MNLKSLIKPDGSCAIPQGIRCIPKSAFLHCFKLTSIIIPNGVTEIGADAFHGCANLKKVILPNSLVSIGSGAFYGCTNLQDIELPAKVIKIGSSAFRRCSELDAISIPANVSTIHSNTFRDCNNLKKISLPSSVIYIGSGAFSGCVDLKSIVLPNSLQAIEKNAFDDCVGLTRVNIPTDAVLVNHLYGDIYTSPVITSFFHHCYGLQEITVDENNLNYCSEGNCLLTEDGKKLLFACRTSVIPSSVIEIAEGAFVGCTDIYIPYSVKTIHPRAFVECPELMTIKVAKDNSKFCAKGNCILTKDGRKLLLGCRTSVIPPCVTEIVMEAFHEIPAEEYSSMEVSTIVRNLEEITKGWEMGFWTRLEFEDKIKSVLTRKPQSKY